MRKAWATIGLTALALAFAALIGPATAWGAPSPSPSSNVIPSYDVDWEAAVNRTIHVGDELELKIGPVGEGAPGGLSLGLAENLGDEGWSIEAPPPADAGRVLHFRAAPIKKGHLKLPELMILDEKGAAVAATRPLEVDVASVIDPNDPKAAEPAPMRPPLKLAFPLWATILLSALALIVLSGLGYLGYRTYRRYRNRSRIEPPKPVEPPRPEDEVALAQLDQLEREDLLTQGKFKAHYFRLSEILKTYLGRRFDFDAPESTSREIVQHLETHPGVLSDRLRQDLERAFQRLDRVKFTDHIPEREEGAELLGTSREFVKVTRRPIVPTLAIPTSGEAQTHAPR